MEELSDEVASGKAGIASLAVAKITRRCLQFRLLQGLTCTDDGVSGHQHQNYWQIYESSASLSSSGDQRAPEGKKKRPCG